MTDAKPIPCPGYVDKQHFTPGTYWVIPLLPSAHGNKPGLPSERRVKSYHPQILHFRTKHDASVSWVRLYHAYSVGRMTTERERWEAEQAEFAKSCRERFQFSLTHKIDQFEGETT